MKFNVDEIFEMAEHIERNGAKFYRNAAGIVQNAHARETLSGLAAMEDEHERTYAELRMKLVKPEERRDTVYESDMSAMEYIRSWADKHVFDIDADIYAELGGDESLDEILSRAIRREKESIILFEGLKDSLNADEDRARVDRIIQEEMDHIKILTKERQALQG
jgi:rubrerythrin